MSDQATSFVRNDMLPPQEPPSSQAEASPQLHAGMMIRVIDDRSGHQRAGVADDHNLSPDRTPQRESRLFVLTFPCGHRWRGRIRRMRGASYRPGAGGRADVPRRAGSIPDRQATHQRADEARRDLPTCNECRAMGCLAGDHARAGAYCGTQAISRFTGRPRTGRGAPRRRR